MEPSTAAGRNLDAWLLDHPLVERLAGSPTRHYYFLEPGVGSVVMPGGDSLRVASAMSNAAAVDLRSITDGRPETGWLASPSQQRDEQLTLALTCAASVTAVTIVQGGYAPAYPRRLAIDAISEDGHETQVWEGPTGAAFLRAALRHPRDVSAIFAVGMSHVRHIRLRSIGRDQQVGWGLADVRVHGQCEPFP